MSRKKYPQIGIFLKVGDRIRKIRGSLTQSEFARILGVKQNAISRYESGRIPDDQTLKKIAAHGNVAIEWILRGDEVRPSPILSDQKPVYESRPMDVDPETLARIILSARSYLQQHPEKLTPLGEATLIADLYCYWSTERHMPDDQVIKAYLPLARRVLKMDEQ